MKNIFITLILSLLTFTYASKSFAQNKTTNDSNKKIFNCIERVRPILNSDQFQNGNYDSVDECIKDIENILIEEGIGQELANVMIGSLFGEEIDNVNGNHLNKPGLDDVGKIGSSAGPDAMAGRIGQDAFKQWNSMCSQLSYLQHSGNGDVVGRDKNMKMGAAGCQKLKEDWGFGGSDYYKETATNSVVGSSHKLNDGEVLGNNSTDDDSSDKDSANNSTTDSTSDSNNDEYDPNASYDDGNGNEKNSSDEDDEDDEKNSSEEDDGSSNTNSSEENKDSATSSSYGRGGSEDPVENEGGVPLSAEAQKQAGKLLAKKNTIGFTGQGQAGGSNDGRGGENDNEGNGTIMHPEETLTPNDDPRLQNGTGHPVSGTVRMTRSEKAGSGVKVLDH